MFLEKEITLVKMDIEGYEWGGVTWRIENNSKMAAKDGSLFISLSGRFMEDTAIDQANKSRI